MCGICGISSVAKVDGARLRRMAERLAHRGPDDEGFYSDGPAGLGHRRLSIIDLAHGRQPIGNEDGTIWTVLNGEIYNHEDLRGPLIEAGHRFQTSTDTEVLVHLYEEYGDDFVQHLRGMFALAIWDAPRRRLLLARDHLGQKPLYYTTRDHELAFASEIKALLADRPELAQVDGAALKEYLTLRVISGDRSMFRNVHKLPAAHLLVHENGSTHVRCYWDLEYGPKWQMREPELLDALEEQLQETLRYHLVSDVPVGAFLSGGLDSSLIVGMLSRMLPDRLQTFSVGVPYKKYSELPYAEAVARHCNTNAVTDNLPASIMQVLPEVIWHLDEPSDPLAPCMFYLSRMTREHVKVVIGGDGGDELFGGYDRYFGNRYIRYYAALPALVRRQVLGRMLALMPEGYWYKSLSHRLRWLHELSFHRGGSRYARSLSYFYFPPNTAQSLLGPELRNLDFDPEGDIRRYFESTAADDLVDRMLYTDSKVRMPNHPVMILDRMSMAFGLEARAPFLDHKLAEFCARIPVQFKIRGRQLRYAQAKLAERYLPNDVIYRHKQGFNSALPYLLADDYRRLFANFLRQSHLVDAGFLERDPIAQMLEQHLDGTRDHGNRLWLLLNSELWYRMHIEGRTVDELREAMALPAGDTAASQPDAPVAAAP